MPLPTSYQQMIHLTRYAKWNDKEKRRENWEQTVERYIGFFRDKFSNKKTNKSKFDSIFIELQKAIENLEVMPSMRCLMTAGKALDRDNVAGYNCGYLEINRIRAFDELMYILLCGTGCGFSVERQFISQLPEIAEDFMPTDTTIQIRDSKLGWTNGFRELISMLYVGRIPKWDVSKIRPAGSRLKTFGGRASGPGPLVELFEFTIDIFKKSSGRKLTSLEAHDICCKIAEIVVVGGVRRSALISLSNLSDERMRGAKTGRWFDNNPQRALANNSVCYTEKPEMEIFMKEWMNLIESKSGERGIFSRPAIKKTVERLGKERRDPEYDFGTNPCSEIILRDRQFCVSGDTPIITKNSISNIKEFDDKEKEIWNGEEWTTVRIRKTGKNQKLMKVTLGDGSYLKCTPDHRWSIKVGYNKSWREVKTKDLVNFSKYPIQVEPANVVAHSEGKMINEAYTLGFAVGDGCVYNGNVIIDTYGEKDWACPISGRRFKKTLKKGYNVECVRIISTEYIDKDLVKSLKVDADEILKMGCWNKESVLNFIAGLADADGTNTNSGGISIYLSGGNRVRNLQLILTKNGIRSTVNLVQKKGTTTNLGIRKKDLFYLYIAECNEIPTHRLNVSKGHKPKYKGKYQIIRDVEEIDGLHDTYCFNEPKKHKGLFANVLTHQCNLTEVIIRPEDTFKILKEKVRLATIMGTFQASLTNFRYLSKKWKENTEEEALLGVSFTGIMDHPILSGKRKINKSLSGWKYKTLSRNLEELRKVAINTNKFWAKRIGINPAAAITCIKPSGCQGFANNIRTNKGNMTIEDVFISNGYSIESLFNLNPGTWLDINNELYVYDENNDLQKITKLFYNGLSEVYEIVVGDNTYHFTPNHKLQLVDESWKEVRYLEEGDDIKSF